MQTRLGIIWHALRDLGVLDKYCKPRNQVLQNFAVAQRLTARPRAREQGGGCIPRSACVIDDHIGAFEPGCPSKVVLQELPGANPWQIMHDHLWKWPPPSAAARLKQEMSRRNILGRSCLTCGPNDTSHLRSGPGLAPTGSLIVTASSEQGCCCPADLSVQT